MGSYRCKACLAPVANTDDEIEVVDERHERWGRIRIRERQNDGPAGHVKTSIFLTADQLEEHARECLALAVTLRNRR